MFVFFSLVYDGSTLKLLYTNNKEDYKNNTNIHQIIIGVNTKITLENITSWIKKAVKQKIVIQNFFFGSIKESDRLELYAPDGYEETLANWYNALKEAQQIMVTSGVPLKKKPKKTSNKSIYASLITIYISK